jgi:hypothetical protein
LTVFEFDAAALLHMVHRPCMMAHRHVGGGRTVVFRSGT